MINLVLEAKCKNATFSAPNLGLPTKYPKLMIKKLKLFIWRETFYSLLVTRYFLLLIFYSLLVTFYPFLITFYSLLVTFFWLLVTFYSLLVTFYSLLFTRYSLLPTSYSLLLTRYSLRFIRTLLHYIHNVHIKLYVSSWKRTSVGRHCYDVDLIVFRLDFQIMTNGSFLYMCNIKFSPLGFYWTQNISYDVFFFKVYLDDWACKVTWIVMIIWCIILSSKQLVT